MSFSYQERYSRQILFPGIGTAGQERLSRSRVLLAGCGALGSVIAEILVRAGVGLTIADRDYIDPSNLQRQSLFTEEDCRAGLPKAAAAARHLRALNSDVGIAERVVDIDGETIGDLVAGCDLILDGTDNFETRFLLNDAAWKWNMPWIYGACVGAYGLSAVFIPGRTPCLRCVMEQLPPPGSSPTCDTGGIIGPIVHMIGALEAAEALKILTGKLEAVNRRLHTVDLWENRISSLDLSRLERDPQCPACGLKRFDFLEGKHTARAETLCGRNAVQIRLQASAPVDFAPVAERLARLGTVTCNDMLLLARVEGFEIALFRDGRGIVRGTEDPEEAKRIYARFVGS